MRMTCTILLLATVASAQYAAVLPEDHLKMLQVNGDGKMMKAGSEKKKETAWAIHHDESKQPLPGVCGQQYWISEQTGTIYHVITVKAPEMLYWKAIAHGCKKCSPNQLVKLIDRRPSSLVSGLSTVAGSFDARLRERLDNMNQRLGDLVLFLSGRYSLNPAPIENWPYSVDITFHTGGALTATGYFIPDVSDVSTASGMKQVLEESAYWQAQKDRRDHVGKTMREMARGAANQAGKDKHEAFGYKGPSKVQCLGSDSAGAVLHFIFPSEPVLPQKPCGFWCRAPPEPVSPFGPRTDSWRPCSDESCSEFGASPESPGILFGDRDTSPKRWPRTDRFGNGFKGSTEQLQRKLGIAPGT